MTDVGLKGAEGTAQRDEHKVEEVTEFEVVRKNGYVDIGMAVLFVASASWRTSGPVSTLHCSLSFYKSALTSLLKCSASICIYSCHCLYQYTQNLGKLFVLCRGCLKRYSFKKVSGDFVTPADFTYFFIGQILQLVFQVNNS